MAAGHDIAAIWMAQRPRKQLLRRDAQLATLAPRWSIKAFARQHSLGIRQVPRLSTWLQRLDEVRATEADVLISVYFRYIVPVDVLEIFGPNAVNLHPAPLPRYRGPHPTHVMVMDRSIKSDAAVTLHVMSPGLDEGNIIARQPVQFPTNRSLTRLSLANAQAVRLLAETALPRYLHGDIVSEPQHDTDSSYARLRNEDFELGPHQNSETVQWLCDTIGRSLHLRVRALPKIKIIGFNRKLGPPTGAVPRVGPTAIDMDVSDARVRLDRKRPWSNWARELRTLAICAGARERD